MDNLQLPLDHDIADFKLRLALQHDNSLPSTVGIKDILQDDDSSVEAMWKIYMKAKDLLPWKERMENLTWRLMYMESDHQKHQHQQEEQEPPYNLMYIDLHQDVNHTTSSSLDIISSSINNNVIYNSPLKQQQQQHQQQQRHALDQDFEMKEPDDIFEEEFDYASHIKKLGQEVIDDISPRKRSGTSPQTSQTTPPKTSNLSMSLRGLLGQQNNHNNPNNLNDDSKKMSSSYDFHLDPMALEGPSGSYLDNDLEFQHKFSPPSRPHTTIGPQSILQNFKQFSHHSQIHQQINNLTTNIADSGGGGNGGGGSSSAISTNNIPSFNRSNLLFRRDHSLVNLNDHFPNLFADLSDSTPLSLPTDSYMTMGLDSSHRPFNHRSSLGLMSLPPSSAGGGGGGSGRFNMQLGSDNDINLVSPEHDSYFDDHLSASHLHNGNSMLSKHFTSFEASNVMMNGLDNSHGPMDQQVSVSASTTPTSNFMAGNLNSSLSASLTSNSSTTTITPVSAKKNNNNVNTSNKKTKSKSLNEQPELSTSLPQTGTSSLSTSPNKLTAINNKKKLTSGASKDGSDKTGGRSNKKKSASPDSTNANIQCTNCHTRTTPLWRRNPKGEPLCNACGLFLKLHGVVRPLSLKTDVIKKRQRGQGTSSRKNSSTNLAASLSAMSNTPPSTAGSSYMTMNKGALSSTNLGSNLKLNSVASSTNITNSNANTNSNTSNSSSSIYHDGDDFNPTAILGNSKKKNRKPKASAAQAAAKVNVNSKANRKSSAMNSPAIMSSVGTPSMATSSHQLDNSLSNTPTSSSHVNPLEFEARGGLLYGQSSMSQPFESVDIGAPQNSPHPSHSLQFDRIQGSPHSPSQSHFTNTDAMDVMPSIEESGDHRMSQNGNAYLFGQEVESGDGNWDWLKMAL
ncbi:uncharacterized protein KQ657_002623 [Scheffersomyces spartinae]|uniref:GATA-type domain-containing protein n=1 Tax=Scheffersomyces spartinae TaxID=45513 RepID=A0A9P7V6C7_9ASCO|nr:uncharacterized protein KQ657_002623 [Scheffersomyces spartinae]KAG7192015.1 hypothetical protein KQ657_002623 [Scheffersomyces spartinae]